MVMYGMKVTYSSTLPPLSHIFLILLLFLFAWLRGSVVHYNLVPVNVCLSQRSAAKPRQVALDAQL